MKIYKFIKFFLFIALGVSIFFLMDTYVEHLRFFIGGLITLYGVDGFFLWILEKDKFEKMHFLFKAVVQLVLGICTLTLFGEYSSPEDVGYKTICIIWAVWAIMREADEISEYYELFKERIPCFLGFIESVVAIVFSITLIMEPGEHHAMIHMYLLIVELFTAVLVPQLRCAYVKYFKKEKEENKK